MNHSDSIVQHISKIQNMAGQLKDVGETISDVFIMVKILGVTPESQTVEYLQERLIKKKFRMTASSDEATNAPAAMSLRTTKKTTNFNEKKDQTKS